MAAVEAGRHNVPFRVVFQEREISEELSAYLRDSGDVTFSDIRVSLQPGGQPLPAVIEGDWLAVRVPRVDVHKAVVVEWC